MGNIYKRAQHVIGWLGDDLRLMNLFRLLNLLQNHKIDLTSNLATHDEIAEVDRFINSAYWSRAWITQEIVSARDFFFLAGTEFLSVAVFTSKAQQFMLKYGTDKWRRILWQPTMMMRQQQIKPTLLENLWHFRHKECYLSRDKIYSLLSISRDGQNVRVDYSLALIQVVQNLFRQEESFCLCQARFVLKTAKLKTWIQDTDISSLGNDVNVPSYAELRARALPDIPQTCPACGITINFKTGQSSIPSYIEALYIYCLACSHSIDAPHEYFLHGHIILGRSRPEFVQDQGLIKWWVYLEAGSSFEGRRTVADAWYLITGAVEIQELSPDRSYVTFRLSFLAFYEAAFGAVNTSRSFVDDGLRIRPMGDGIITRWNDHGDETVFRLLRTDLATKWNPSWRFL